VEADSRPKALDCGVALRPPLYYMVGWNREQVPPWHWRQRRFRSRRMPDYQVKNVEPVAVGADVQVRVFTLTDGEEIPWHYHSESTDHYFVLRGKLTIETRSPHHRHRLDVGESYKILPGTAHHISNESAAECQFLLVQGVGKYDWQKADLSKDKNPSS
jgi:quercetin dioxygenase-like cupin family protein